MKKVLFSFLAISVILFSCDKEDNNVTPPPPAPAFQWPAGTNEYAPHTMGSTFTFESAAGTPVVIDSFTYTVVKDTTINALPFKKLTSNKPALGPTFFANYNAGVVTNISYNIDFQGLATIPVVSQTILKDNVAVNTTWAEMQNITVSGFTIPVTFSYTLMQKDYTKVVLAKDYANTIEVKQVISIPAQIAVLAGIPASNTVNNYFAKGAGLIERTGVGNSVKIKRYTVVK